jgi:hypothetical protein
MSFLLPKKRRIRYLLFLAVVITIYPALSDSLTESSRIHLRTHSIPLGEIKLTIEIVERGSPAVTFFNMHDNENTAVEAAKMVLAEKEGRFVQLIAQGARLIAFPSQGRKYTFDPNRMFTALGIEKTLKTYGASSLDAKAAITTFASKLINQITPGTQVIIAVHNNTPGDYSINSYTRGALYEKDAAEAYVNHHQDPDNFYYVTDSSLFAAIKKGGYNVVLQNAAPVIDDGSLSVYCGRKGIRYVNVETEQGQLDQQVAMLKFALMVLRK